MCNSTDPLEVVIVACKHGCCVSETIKNLLSAWKTALIILLVGWEYWNQTHVVFSLHVMCQRIINNKEAFITEMRSLVTRRLYGQAVEKIIMVYSEVCENATETKQWLQKECSIKVNRIKSNKNPKAANKGAAYFKSIYNSLQLFWSQYAFKKTFF